MKGWSAAKSLIVLWATIKSGHSEKTKFIMILKSLSLLGLMQNKIVYVKRKIFHSLYNKNQVIQVWNTYILYKLGIISERNGVASYLTVYSLRACLTLKY